MTQPISRAQQLVLELMRLASFNEFDGDRVVDDLIRHRDLWVSCFWLSDWMPLRPLIYLHEDYYFGDTLYILTTTDKVPMLERLAQQWEADAFWAVDANDEHNQPHEREELEKLMGYDLENITLDIPDAVPCICVVWWD